MNFHQLEYVIAVHNHHHFGRAAESCHVTQATLSGMIKKLEEELEVVLFDRSRSPVQTTEAGEQFVEIAMEILDRQKRLFALKDRSEEPLSGKLTIGIIPTVAGSLLPLILPTIIKENPDLQLTLAEITTEEIVQQLQTDRIDLGILATPLEESGIEGSILYYEPMLVYGKHGEAKKYVSSADVRDNKIWLLEEGHCFRNQTMTVCDIREKDLGMENLHFLGNSFETLLNLTDEFGGYTLVPELYVRTMPEYRKGKTKPFQVPVPVREISLVYARPYARSHAVERLTELVQRLVVGELSSGDYKNSELEIIGI